MGSSQVYDALSILFKFEKLLVEYFEGFILLLKKGGMLQNFFRTYN